MNTTGLGETRAYVGVVASEALGAVILGSSTYSPNNDGFHAFDFGTIPEPATGVVVLLGVGLCGMRRIGRRR